MIFSSILCSSQKFCNDKSVKSYKQLYFVSYVNYYEITLHMRVFLGFHSFSKYNCLYITSDLVIDMKFLTTEQIKHGTGYLDWC